MASLNGQSIGRYHILESLGEGGMATVYKAYDTRLERNVAVKVIRTDQFAPALLAQVLKRFEREAKALARLTHPNIVHVNDYGEHDGIPYLVMDFLPGGTLKQSFKGEPMPWREAIKLLLPIAEALSYAHEHEILHRDVKPSNILLTDKGRPMLTDFGIAKILDLEEGQTLTATGVGIGTPEYMSPEQGLGRGVDARTDIYSLGIVLYELVTGRKPYTADTPMAVVDKHVHDPLPRPSQVAPGLPEAIENLLLKMLAKNPDDRYPDMAAVVSAMEGLLSGTAIAGGLATQLEVEQPVPPTAAPRTPVAVEDKTKSKSWLVWIAVILGLLCLGLFTAGGIFAAGRMGLFSGSTSTSKPTESKFQTDVVPQQSPARATASLVPSAIPDLYEPFGKIVFTCQVSRQEESNEICLINADGTGFRQLTKNAANNNYPSLAPDGRSIVYSSNTSGSFQIYEMDLGTNSTWQLTDQPGEANAPDISPDGNEIVYKHSEKIDSIWVMNRDGSNPREVISRTGWDPVWSPDGSELLFTSGAYDHPQLYIMAANGANLRQITNMDNLRGRSDWSPLGQIATYAGVTNSRSIYVMDEDGSDVRQISTGGNSLAPSFSPDGNWIVFTGYIDRPSDGNGCEIYIMRVDGSDIRRLTDNNYCDWQPRWGQ